MTIILRTAATEEVDEPDLALNELLEQLNVSELKANSLGLLYCHLDFIESGLVEHITRALPFDVIGMTTMASASLGTEGLYRLTLAVLTSDDVRFTAASTPPLTPDTYQQIIATSWQEALARAGATPRFIIGYFPFSQGLSGQDMLSAFDETSGHIPLWGSIASGTDMTYIDCYTIHNDAIGRASAVFALIEGNVEPDFIVTSIPERNISERKAMVTKSHGCTLNEINDMPALDYIDQLGIIFNQGDQTTVPLIVDYRDGSQPVALGMYAFLEDRSILCGGLMPEGALLSLGEIDSQGILETMRFSLNKLCSFTDKTGLLLLPCVTRFVMLAPRQEDEMQETIERLEGVIPYQLGYSGGEFCPVRDENGIWRNRFHNYTFTACAF